MKEFFSVKEKKYKFEIWDITALITVLNVIFIFIGFWWASIFGIVNCVICLIINVIDKAHFNNYVTQVSLILLNIYFLII